jgi:predicted nucleotidyltransferase
MKPILTIEYLREKKLIIFETVTGSNAYGTNISESDVDIRGVFITPLNYVLKYGFVDQVSDKENDVIFYELGRFVKLLIDNNPNILELLNSPEDCVVYRDQMFKLLELNKDKFLTKRVRYTFAGYAIDQIKKARGYNKKMNWEEANMTRKTVLDFCYVMDKEDTNPSKPFKKWLKDWNKEYGFVCFQEQFGLASMDHARDLYAMYWSPEKCEWGIVSDEETANDVKLTSIPKGSQLVNFLSFNKDGYSSHCRKYKEYQTWLKERNPNRFKMNKAHGKNYDSKNLMHTYRLLLMAHELAKGELRVRRTLEEIEKLMKIRKGEYEYEDLLNEAETMISGLDEKFENSKLPDKVDEEMAYEMLLEMRKHYYKL